MERSLESRAFLDTHVVVWLYDALTSRFGSRARELINKSDLRVSPIVRLELAYLYELGRVTAAPREILRSLATTIGLEEDAQTAWGHVIDQASELTWTRDPFDRLIAAHATCLSAPLLTADSAMLQHYRAAIAPSS